MFTPITPSDKQECLTHLKNLIRLNTTNPPGNEIIAATYLKEIFDKEGIPYTILESAPGRANIIARLSGDGSKGALLLNSHLDVVPAEPEHWDVDPFSAEEKDGCIWGRGAVDMKNVTAMELAVFLKLHRDKIPLKRDVILAAVADEEAGCAYGSRWLVDNHADLIQAETCINEVGGFSLWIDDQVFYPIGVGEKGVCWFDLVAKGEPGHGGLPHQNQAIGKLAKAAETLSQNKLDFKLNSLTEEFVTALAAQQSFPKSKILKAMLNPRLSNFVIQKILPDKAKASNFWNMFRNTATPTILKAGDKVNVIPSEARLTVDARIVPGSSVEELLTEVRERIGSDFEIEVQHQQEPSVTERRGEFFDLASKTLRKHHPGCHPIPFLIPGFSDSGNYAKLGIQCFGFAPVKLPPDLNFGALYHGHNERIPIGAMEFAVDVLWDVVSEWVT